MALNETQQIKEVIKKSHHILITLQKDFSVDAVASALALYLILQKLAKQNNNDWGGEKLVDIVCDGFELPENLKFLSKTNIIASKINNLQKFVISLNAGKDKIDEFSYNLNGDDLQIYITPKTGSFNKQDVQAKNSDYKYDLIFTIGADDLDSLGKSYQNYTDFFFNTTIVNIDNKAENEHFGQINLTNLNAVASAEILFTLISEIDRNLIDPEIATCLLTGLIAQTKSFKTPNVTPKTLEIAGALMAAEADRGLIIKNLYRNRSLSTLKLWGRVLARLKSNSGNKLVWSLLTEHDFIEADASSNDLPEVVDELISFVPGVDTVILLYQQNNKICVLVNTLRNENALYLTKEFKPTGSKNVVQFFLTDKTLQQAENEVIDKITANLSRK